MTLIAEIEDELREATLAREAERRDTLRLILAALRGAEKELQRPLTGDEELQVLQRERKRRTAAAKSRLPSKSASSRSSRSSCRSR
jgi:uncharacterized protein YqeY